MPAGLASGVDSRGQISTAIPFAFLVGGDRQIT
jgi:hypothetical protein